MAENLDLTKGIQIIPQSSTPTGDLPVPELTPAMEPATITTPSPPISSSGGSSTGVITEFLGFSIEFWLIAFLILGLATLVYMYWDQIQGVIFGEASTTGKPATSDAANVVADVLTDAIDGGISGGNAGYPCELGRDKDGRPVIVRVASRKMCK